AEHGAHNGRHGGGDDHRVDELSERHPGKHTGNQSTREARGGQSGPFDHRYFFRHAPSLLAAVNHGVFHHGSERISASSSPQPAPSLEFWCGNAHTTVVTLPAFFGKPTASTRTCASCDNSNT